MSREQLLKRVKRQSVSYSWRYKPCVKRNRSSTTNYDPILYLNNRHCALRMSYPCFMLKVPANISLFFCTYSILFAGYSSISTFVRLATVLYSAHSLSGTDWSILSISRLLPIALSTQKQWSVNPTVKNKGNKT